MREAILEGTRGFPAAIITKIQKCEDLKEYEDLISPLLDNKFNGNISSLVVHIEKFPHLELFCDVLASYIERFSNIKNFNFVFGDALYRGENELTNRAVNKLFDAMRRKNNIEYVTLMNCPAQEKEENQKFQEGLVEIILNNPDLKMLDVHISEDMVETLSDLLPQAPHLTDLALRCGSLSQRSQELLAQMQRRMPQIDTFEFGLKIGEEQDPSSVLHLEGTVLSELSKKHYKEAEKIYQELKEKIKTISSINLEDLEKRYQDFIQEINSAKELEHPETDLLMAQAELDILLSLKHFKFFSPNTTLDEKIQIVEFAYEITELLNNISLTSNSTLLLNAALKVLNILQHHRENNLEEDIERLENTYQLCEKITLSAIETFSNVDRDIHSEEEVKTAEKNVADCKFKNLLPIYFSQLRLAKIKNEDDQPILGKINAILKNKELRKKVDAEVFSDAYEKFTECLTSTDARKKDSKTEPAFTPISTL